MQPLRQGFGSLFGFFDPEQLGSWRNPWLVTDAGDPVQQTGHLTDLLTEGARERLRALGYLDDGGP